MATDQATLERAETTDLTRDDALSGGAAITHMILRIGAGLLFMQHGVQKLFGWLGGFGGTPGNTAELFSQMGLAGVLETFGGLLIVIGFLTRPVAVILALEMVAAYVIAHAPQGGFPIQNGGELALLYTLVWLFIAMAGAGPLSVDAALARRDVEGSTSEPEWPAGRRAPAAGTPPGAGGRRPYVSSTQSTVTRRGMMPASKPRSRNN